MTRSVTFSLVVTGFTALFFILSGFVNHDSIVFESLGRIAAEHGIDLSASAAEPYASSEEIDSVNSDDICDSSEFESITGSSERLERVRMPLAGSIGEIRTGQGKSVRAGEKIILVDDSTFVGEMFSLRERIVLLREETETWQNVISSFKGIRALEMYGVRAGLLMIQQILAEKISHIAFLENEIVCNEAMIETCTVRAPENGIVEKVCVREGDAVSGGTVLLLLRPLKKMARRAE
ncbi:MAG: hypothetical protein CVV64_04445 [Candidatus Wallbacteria bacterium HGW-Wallbacteria-1]|jgi:biotin carboxyl carrier protein|uniref:Lipoyl-binding domain-containing protein n=1 Tax=Candidatus Wallbacteria bacterium HGW-Wallbacteria-1 TaxID=2013854 RepID=A0A2N1PRR4_9BACT|nr:MAG: hypothetical protein CVV64_04445 [Candidatus Wallbacteria bacterium HGW-Wallbacteria-1]